MNISGAHSLVLNSLHWFQKGKVKQFYRFPGKRLGSSCTNYKLTEGRSGWLYRSLSWWSSNCCFKGKYIIDWAESPFALAMENLKYDILFFLMSICLLVCDFNFKSKKTVDTNVTEITVLLSLCLGYSHSAKAKLFTFRH